MSSETRSRAVLPIGGRLSLVLTLILVVTGCEVIDQVAREMSTPQQRGEAPRAPSKVAGGGGPSIRLSNATARPGGEARVAATLSSAGRSIAGAQNDIAFSTSGIAIAARQGKPDCSVNPRIGKGASAFAFTPHGCSGSGCKGARAIILSVTDVRPIADGSELYSCRVTVPNAATPGTHTLGVTGVALSTPDGQAVEARGVGATIEVR